MLKSIFNKKILHESIIRLNKSKTSVLIFDIDLLFLARAYNENTLATIVAGN